MKKILSSFIICSFIFCFYVAFAEPYSQILEKAERGDMAAQFEMGELYRTGVNFPQNYKQAYIWFSLSAAQGNKSAQKKRNSLENKLTPQQIGEAQDIAVLKQQIVETQKTKTHIPKGPSMDEPSIDGKFITNSKIGDLFIVTGRVKNHAAEAVQYIKVRGYLQTNSRKHISPQEVYCGNVVDDNSLRDDPFHKIRNRLLNKSGNNGSNEEIKPNDTIPFMVVFSDLPSNLKNFNVKISDYNLKPVK